jgi:tetratricopeptide (TPR) repeat protein
MKIKETSIIDLRERESFLVRIKANICTWKGEIHRSLDLNKKAFELAKDSKNKELTSASLINIAEKYDFLGDYENAKLYAERAIKIQYQPWFIYQLGFMIDILLDKGDVKGANYYFRQISDIREKDKSKLNNVLYRYYKALLLKTSLRSKNRVKSEKLFKQIIDTEEILAVSGSIKSFWAKKSIFVIINICDLLLTELRITNYPEIIDEIQPYIQKLIDFGEQQHSYWILCETHLLQAKLSLLTFDIQKAKRFLTQAQQVAGRFGLAQLSTKIAKEYDDLLKKEDLWQKLKSEGAPMANRADLARLDEQIEGMIRNPTIPTAYVRDERVAISKEIKICLVCRGDVLRFSYICECGAIYCENCARAITDLENICWICDIPIDYLKPVKLYKDEGKNLEVKKKIEKY